MKLQLYVLRTVATRILGAALILMSILQILDLLDVTPDILDRGLGIAGVAYYAAMRLPRLFEQVAPIAVLAGGLFAFSQLARESAVVAMRATGISGYRIVGMAVPCRRGRDAAGRAVRPGPGPARRSGPGRLVEEHDPGRRAQGPRPAHLPRRRDLVIAASASADGRRSEYVTIFRRDNKGILVEKIEAPKARFTRPVWTLDRPTTTRFTGDLAQTSTASNDLAHDRLTPQDVQGLFGDNDAMPTAASARRALQNGGSDRPRASTPPTSRRPSPARSWPW
jgi:lipopolysaccharide export system permease protein